MELIILLLSERFISNNTIFLLKKKKKLWSFNFFLAFLKKTIYKTDKTLWAGSSFYFKNNKMLNIWV